MTNTSRYRQAVDSYQREVDAVAARMIESGLFTPYEAIGAAAEEVRRKRQRKAIRDGIEASKG